MLLLVQVVVLMRVLVQVIVDSGKMRTTRRRHSLLVRVLEAEECSTCLDLVSDESNFQLPCGHRFHRKCVKSLRLHGGRKGCPNCCEPLPPGPREAIERSAFLLVCAEMIEHKN